MFIDEISLVMNNRFSDDNSKLMVVLRKPNFSVTKKTEESVKVLWVSYSSHSF